MLSGAVEFFSYTACFSINQLGRKGPHVFSMLVAGLACLGTILVNIYEKGKCSKNSLKLTALALVMIVAHHVIRNTTSALYLCKID